MNEYLPAAALALVQGVTEFLPISSSGHLILLPRLVGWEDQGLAFDVAVHVGTLLAVLGYFWRDIIQISSHWFGGICGRGTTAYSQLGWVILIATAITASAAWLAHDFIAQHLRNLVPIALATLLFGIVLGIADWRGSKRRELGKLGWRDALILGCAQALALIPGTSRSGIVITAALFLGLNREAAARVAFLMAIPIIALAGVWEARGLSLSTLAVRWDILLFATALSAAVAFACIHALLLFLRRYGLMLFVIYRLLLGILLLIFAV